MVGSIKHLNDQRDPLNFRAGPYLISLLDTVYNSESGSQLRPEAKWEHDIPSQSPPVITVESLLNAQFSSLL